MKEPNWFQILCSSPVLAYLFRRTILIGLLISTHWWADLRWGPMIAGWFITGLVITILYYIALTQATNESVQLDKTTFWSEVSNNAWDVLWLIILWAFFESILDFIMRWWITDKVKWFFD